MEMLVDSFLSYFGYELDFKTFFLGCQKVVALTSSELLGKIFLFNFESCPFNNISVIFFFFFFFKFCRPSCGTHLKWVAGQDFFPSFAGQVVAPTSNELLAKIFFTSFVGQVVALTSSELLAKIFLFSFESCPFNNISVIRIF